MSDQHDGVRLFGRLPDDYSSIGVKTSRQMSDIGPCILLYDIGLWTQWDNVFWFDNGVERQMRAPQPDEPSPCQICGQPVACLRGGPGALAVWQGPTAQAILDSLWESDEEWLLSDAWERFSRNAPLIDLMEFRLVAEHVVSDRFCGFRKIRSAYGIHTRWMESVYAESDQLPQWVESFSPLVRSRHLPALLSILESLGVRTPALPDSESGERTAADLAHSGANITLKRIADDKAAVMTDIKARSASSLTIGQKALPKPMPSFPGEELAEALMGYDHTIGEAIAWPTCDSHTDMLGHNSRIMLEE